MSGGQSIFERLQLAKEESKKVDSVKNTITELSSELDGLKNCYNDLVVKIENLTDLLSTRAKVDDVYILRAKMTKDLEDMKSKISGVDVEKRVIDDITAKFVLVDVFEKELEELKMALETYVKNQPTSYEARIKKLEDKSASDSKVKATPVVVRSFK